MGGAALSDAGVECVDGAGRTATSSRTWRLAAVIERPIPFYVPHYRSLHEQRDVDLDVIYLSDAGLRPFKYHEVEISYDDEILQGYSSLVLGRSGSFVERALRAPRLVVDLWRALSGKGYDAVWVHGYNLVGHWLTFAVCLLLRIPVMLRGESELMFERNLPRRIVKDMVFRTLFPRIAAFLYIGTLNKQFYRSYGVPDAKLFPVPYGIDNSAFGEDDDQRRCWRTEIRRLLGIDDDAVVFVNHSKHRAPKRPADVVRAFGRLDPRSGTVLLLVGDGDDRNEVDAACAALSDRHRVFRLGFRPYEDLRKILCASDVLVFASEENWGMAVNEGLAAGLAILCSDKVAGAIDMVEEGVNGRIFRSRDEDDLAARMRDLAADVALVARMGRASRKKAESFGFDAMNQGIISALTAVSVRRRPGWGA